MDQPSKVVAAARGQLNREIKINISLSAFAPENLVSRDRFGSPVTRQPAHLQTQAESGAYLRDSSRVPRRRPFIYFKPPYAIESVPSFSGPAIAYRWRSLPRVRRHRASKPQGSSEQVLPWQVTMCVCVCVCVCFFPFMTSSSLDVPAGVTQEEGHRISHPPSFCGACLNFSREKDSAIPFPRRP